MSFHDRLREARCLRKIGQAKLARLADVHATQVSHWEAGRRLPSVDNLCALAKALTVSTDSLMGLAPMPEPPPVPAPPRRNIVIWLHERGGDYASASDWIEHVLAHGWEAER